MSKNLSHMTSIHEASQELHRMFLNSSWYLRCQVMSQPEERTAVTSKQEARTIVVYVKDLDAANGPVVFKSWPVRYELGA